MAENIKRLNPKKCAKSIPVYSKKNDDMST